MPPSGESPDSVETDRVGGGPRRLRATAVVAAGALSVSGGSPGYRSGTGSGTVSGPVYGGAIPYRVPYWPRWRPAGPGPYRSGMDHSERPGAPIPAGARDRDEPAPALADAGDIVERAAADEAAADEARLRFRREGLPALPPDARIAPLLEPDERVVAVRHAALLERREPAPGTRLTPGVAGELYVTSRRLVLIGRVTLSFELETIADAVLSGERLLLVLHDGHGVALQVAGPRLLAVEIAAARGSARSAQLAPAGADPGPADR